MARGGKREGSGRKPGTPNKATADVRAAAQKYTVEAVERLAFWMKSDNAKASVSACNALLDRAHGKPPQAITNPDGSDLSVTVKKIVDVIVQA